MQQPLENLNAAQMQAVQQEVQRIIASDIGLRKWVVEVVLQHSTRDVPAAQEARELYDFIIGKQEE